MKITISLEEILQKCDDWGKFCNEYGWSQWAVNEGGGEIEQELTLEEAIKHGIIKEEK